MPPICYLASGKKYGMQIALIRKVTTLVTLFLIGVTVAFGQSARPPHSAKKPDALNLPVGFTVPKSTCSPDGRFGVLVPDENHVREGVSQNAVIDLRSGAKVGTIRGFTGLNYPERNHFDPARWSVDCSRLLWEVEGKWADEALVLITIGSGKIVSQLDIKDIAERAIDARTKQALRRMHKTAKTLYVYIDVHVEGNLGARISLPLKIHAVMQPDKNAAMDPNLPSAGSEMDALVTESGKIVVTHFKMDD